MEEDDLLFGHAVPNDGQELWVVGGGGKEVLIVGESGFALEFVQIFLCKLLVYRKDSYLKLDVNRS